jgi:hypothetical protein
MDILQIIKMLRITRLLMTTHMAIRHRELVKFFTQYTPKARSEDDPIYELDSDEASANDSDGCEH